MFNKNLLIMTTIPQQRLLLLHSHIKAIDESQLVQLYPYLSVKERVKYQNGFQSYNRSDQFPLNDNISVRPSPLIFTKAGLMFNKSNTQQTIVEKKIELVQQLVGDKTVVINLNDNDGFDNNYDEYDEYDNYIVVIDEVTTEVSDLLSELDTSKLNIITEKVVDFDANILVYDNYLITTNEVESEFLKEVQSEDDSLDDKKRYEINTSQIM